MRYERLLAELVAVLLQGSPMYKCSHEPLCVHSWEERKSPPRAHLCGFSSAACPWGGTGGSFRSSHTLREWLPVHGLSCAPLLLAPTLKEGVTQLGM